MKRDTTLSESVLLDHVRRLPYEGSWLQEANSPVTQRH